MNAELVVEKLFACLTSGNRDGARDLVDTVRGGGVSHADIAHEVFWPTLNTIADLYRKDQLTTLSYNYATRLLRVLVDQAQAEYVQADRNGRTILMFSGPGELDEISGQLVADLLESSGYQVMYGGGGVANDEIMEEVGQHHPDVLLMFASAPADAPNIRLLIDGIRGVNACPEMQIVVGGGVFGRAEGLAEEIGADLWGHSAAELIESLEAEPARRATSDQRTVGRTRQRHAA